MAYKEEWEDCCGRCFFHRPVDGEWVCANDKSECYGCETAYSDDPCTEFESRSGRRLDDEY